MLHKKLLPASIAAVVLLGAASAQAEIGANVTLATDYTFRGISQTGERGAIQGGFDWAGETGLYAGIWGSNINFGGDASTEMDYYGGFAGETGGGLGYDIGFIYYDYENEPEFDYLEFALGLSYADFSVGVNYSDEFGDGGPTYIYYSAGYSMSLSEQFSVGFNIGYTDTDQDDFWEDGADTYMDYGITLGYSAYELDFALAFIGTDLDDVDAADDRVVFSISKSF
ncbi:TorF family putative porin [Haliea sp. E1-2-M8]|uniref:TorF family putative porin n=1 Tax=Haliea sp. E1-2-M8 TaxID=3064706 RepID=UPI0027170100|nr:TorF family putative porin [Haliea sp. E1-2-M8]MDO8861805.1 TorF family putative porin [Haliea sp. E1-2-M8]